MVWIHTVLGLSWDGAMTRIEFSAAFMCRCHPVHYLLFVLGTMNRIHISGSESADGRPPNFVKDVNRHPCLGFPILDVML